MTQPISNQVGSYIDQHRYLNHLDKKKSASLIAQAVASLIPGVALFYSVQSARQAYAYSKIERTGEITQASHIDIITKQLKAERIASAVSQFVFGAGIILLLTALILSYTQNVEIMMYAGAGLAGLGILGYVITQIICYPRDHSLIMNSYRELNKPTQTQTATAAPAEQKSPPLVGAAYLFAARPHPQAAASVPSQASIVVNQTTPAPSAPTSRQPSPALGGSTGSEIPGVVLPPPSKVKKEDSGSGSDSDPVVISGAPSRKGSPNDSPKAKAKK